MMILKKSKSEHGQYSAPQTFPSSVCPDGFLIFPETFLHVFYPEDKQYAGFVDINVEDDTVTSCTWNEEAYQAYIASLPDPTDSVKAEKITEIKKDCEDYIYAGTSVTYTDGATEHFTYNLADQSNISEMFTAVMAGATEYPYHADGEICKIYTKEQIVAIYGTLSLFKTEATTYHNSLKAQINAMTDIDAISATKFKETELTGEYLTNYAAMMASAQTQLNAILAKIPADEAV